MLVQQSLGVGYHRSLSQSPPLVSVGILSYGEQGRSPRLQLSRTSMNVLPSLTGAGNSMETLATTETPLVPSNVNANTSAAFQLTSLRPTPSNAQAVATSGDPVEASGKSAQKRRKGSLSATSISATAGSSATPSSSSSYSQNDMATAGLLSETHPEETGVPAAGTSSPSKTPLQTLGLSEQVQPRLKKQRVGRERVRINLAPDQPPTTQGKPRERVYVACVQWCVVSRIMESIAC